MSTENNRPPISRTNFFDGQNLTDLDFLAEQEAEKLNSSYIVADFAGSGVLQKNPITLPPILDTANPLSTNISFNTLHAGSFDGKGIFVDRQTVDNQYGDQLLITVENADIPLYSPLQVIVFGKCYDPNNAAGNPVLETLTFNGAGQKATLNYFRSVIAVFFNNFSGGIGRTALLTTPQTSLNTAIIGLTPRITIKEVGALEVFDYGTIIAQTDMPNLEIRDFITSTITRTFNDELTATINTAQNTNYVPVSLTDLNALPLNTTGLSTRPFLDSTTNGVFYGQKIQLTTNNIQQLAFSLSLDSGSNWSGEFVIGIRELQTTNLNQYASAIQMDPDVNVLFEASFTQADLLTMGYALTTTPQEVRFNFIGTALCQPQAILTANSYYIITLTRRADVSVGKIYIDVGQKELTNSLFTSFNPTTRAWTDDATTDMWFKVYSAAVRVSSGIAYTTSGSMISLQKTITAQDGSIVSSIAGPYSLAVVDSSGSDNIVILQATQTFSDPGVNPRTGNLVYLRTTDSPNISVLNAADFNTLVASTNDAYDDSFPIVLAVVNDLNSKSYSPFAGVISFVGQVRKNEIVLFNTDIPDRLVEVNSVITPNNSSAGIQYRIVSANSTTQYLGDFDNNKIFTSSDLNTQVQIQNIFSAQSTNTNTNTSFDPFSIFDTRSRDILGFGAQTIENFIVADVDGYLTITSNDVARLQYLTTTLPVNVSPAPSSITIQTLQLENITKANTPILITTVDNTDGYSTATFPDTLLFTAPSVGDMRAISVNDIVDLSVDNFATTSYSDLTIKEFVQRNDLLIETRFASNVLPTVQDEYVLSFYSSNPVFNGKLGVFGEVATEVLEFVAPGIDMVAANILPNDVVRITGDALTPTNRNRSYVVSKVIDATTFRVVSPTLAIPSGIANAGIEFFTSDGYTDKLNAVGVVGFTTNGINLLTSNIEAGDKVHISSDAAPSSRNGLYTVARVLSATTFTVVPPGSPLVIEIGTATFEFRDSADIVVKIAPTSITNAATTSGPTPILVADLETLSPAVLPNSIDTIFTFSLTHTPITGDVLVHWITNGIAQTMLFSASPVQITGDGNPANSSINRLTGTITIDTFLPADTGTSITTDYRIAPIVVLKAAYPTVVNAVSPTQTDIEFRVPYVNAVPNTDINGISTSAYTIIQTNLADPPGVVLDGAGNVVAGNVQVNTINPTNAITLPALNTELRLIDGYGNAPNFVNGQYFMRIYSQERINLPAIQKEFLSNSLSLSAPISYTIQRNNFEWLDKDMAITDYRRFLPAAFVSKQPTSYISSTDMWVPNDLYVGNGQILQAPGVPYAGDIEMTKLTLELPITALLSNNINIYNNFIAQWSQTPELTRGGYTAMKFSDGSYVGSDDDGLNTALTKNQVRVVPSIASIYLDGYKVPNATTYTSLDQVLTLLHYEVRNGLYYDDGYGILYFHIENIKAIFEDEPIIQTGICRVVLDIALKKSGFTNIPQTINSVDIGRYFTNPIVITPQPQYSIAGQITAGFTVGLSVNNANNGNGDGYGG